MFEVHIFRAIFLDGRINPQSELRHLTAQRQMCHELRRNSV